MEGIGFSMVAPEHDDGFLRRNRLATLLAVMAITFGYGGGILRLLPPLLEPGVVLPMFVGASLLLWRYRPLPRGAVLLMLAWFAGMALLALWQGLLGGAPGGFLGNAVMMGLCLGAFALLSQRLAAVPSARIVLSCTITAAALTVGAVCTWGLLDADVGYLKLVYDPVLYRMDAMLGLGHQYMLGMFLQQHAWLRNLMLAVYKFNLFIVISGMFSEGLYSRKAAAELGAQLLVCAFLAFPLFCIMPAVAPLFYFGAAFPAHMPDSQTVLVHASLTAANTVRNTMPSIHTSWALLLLLALRDSPWWHRALAALFVAATILATLGFGEHYAVDLIAAVPFVLLVRGLCCAGLPFSAPARLWPMVYGAALLALWVAMVRGAPASLAIPGALQALAVLSVAGSVALEQRLAVAERGHLARPLPQPAPVLPGAR